MAQGGGTNYGVQFGESTRIEGGQVVAGVGNTVSPSPEPAGSGGQKYGAEAQWDIGVITVLAEEARAVHDELGLAPVPGSLGNVYSAGRVDVDGRPVSVVAARAHAMGQRSAMGACQNLHLHFAPAVLALVGIGGGVHRKHAQVGDVVIATQVVYYDLRKETAQGTVRRGEAREAPASAVHAVNAYFTTHGQPAEFPGQADGFRGRRFAALPGPIGTGEAVVADAESPIREYLTRFNDKTLAVDMEAGGLTQFWQESSMRSAHGSGWVVVRGISDRADSAKDDRHHALAARNAAHVLRKLIPFLAR